MPPASTYVLFCRPIWTSLPMCVSESMRSPLYTYCVADGLVLSLVRASSAEQQIFEPRPLTSLVLESTAWRLSVDFFLSLARGTGTAGPRHENATSLCLYRVHVCAVDGLQGPERQLCETSMSLLCHVSVCARIDRTLSRVPAPGHLHVLPLPNLPQWP